MVILGKVELLHFPDRCSNGVAEVLSGYSDDPETLWNTKSDNQNNSAHNPKNRRVTDCSQSSDWLMVNNCSYM